MTATRARFLVFIFCLAAIFQLATSGWQQTLSEEFFSSDRLNSSLWIPAFYWQPDPSPNNELQSFRPDAFNFSSSSSLGIVASKGSTSGRYNSGVITSRDRWNQLFGYVEFRARLPTAKGVMASFRLVTQDTMQADHTISINVVLNETRGTYFITKCGDTTIQHSVASGLAADLNLHKFGIEWASNATTFYIDDKKVISQATCFTTPMYVVANLVVGGNLAGSPPVSTTFPVAIDIDYIRAYQYDSLDGVSLPGPGAGYESTAIIPTRSLVVSDPTLSLDVARLGDTITSNITITTEVDIFDGITYVENATIEVSIRPSSTELPLIFMNRLTGVTLYMETRTITTTTILTNLTAGYYRVGLNMYDGTQTKMLGLNTVQLFQVLPVTPPVAPPVKPPVSPPVAPPRAVQAPVTPQVSPIVSNVIPILDCYAPINATHYRAYFSYENKNSGVVTLPIGDRNKITPGATNRGQPSVFNAGRSSLFPDSVFVTDTDNNIEWVLSSYTVDVDVTDTSSLCPNSVTIVIVVSSSSALNDTKVDELKDVIASQLNVTSDNVQINVTCSSSTSCEISVTISTDPSQIGDLIQKAKDYANDPATVENNLKQVSTDLSVTEVRGTRTNTEKTGSTSNSEPMAPSVPSNAVLRQSSSILYGFITTVLVYFLTR